MSRYFENLMPLEIKFPTCQLLFLSVSVVLSSCVLIPMSMHINDFGGRCALFTNGSWNEYNGKLDAVWASRAYCGYDIAFAGISALICLTQIPRFAVHMWRRTDTKFLNAFLDVILSCLMCAGSGVAAIFLTWGFKVWCDTVMQRFKTCEDGSISSIIDGDIDSTNFYMHLGTAQFGAWGMWICWVGLLVTSILKVHRFHQVENVRSSISRERSRLIAG